MTTQSKVVELETQLAAANQTIADMRADAATAAATARRAESVAFCERLAAAGRMKAEEVAPALALFEALPSADAPLHFGEGDNAATKPAVDILRGFLSMRRV